MTPITHLRNRIDQLSWCVAQAAPGDHVRRLSMECSEQEGAVQTLDDALLREVADIETAKPALRRRKVRLSMKLTRRVWRGFTLIEMVIVLVIIGVLAVMAMPDLSAATIRGQIKESGPLIDVAKQGVVRAWGLTGKMPIDNTEAGIPEPAKMVGKYVAVVTVKDGAVNVTWGNSINGSIKDKVLTLRPAYVEGQPAVPVTWICAGAPVPTGMVLAGVDATDMPQKYVPPECQARAAGK